MINIRTKLQIGYASLQCADCLCDFCDWRGEQQAWEEDWKMILSFFKWPPKRFADNPTLTRIRVVHWMHPVKIELTFWTFAEKLKIASFESEETIPIVSEDDSHKKGTN